MLVWVESRSLYFLKKDVEVILLHSQVKKRSSRVWEKEAEQRKSKETDRAAGGQRDVRVVLCRVFQGRAGCGPRR